jgi:hypothetical protein
MERSRRLLSSKRKKGNGSGEGGGNSEQAGEPEGTAVARRCGCYPGPRLLFQNGLEQHADVSDRAQPVRGLFFEATFQQIPNSVG